MKTAIPFPALLAGMIAACSACLPAIAAADQAPRERPRIGLVLAGGGAQGGAHIGALKVLEEMRVRPKIWRDPSTNPGWRRNGSMPGARISSP